MWLVILIGLGVVAYLVFGRGNKDSSEDQLIRRNLEWIQFIIDYKKYAKTKDQEELIDDMLAHLASKGQIVPGDTSGSHIKPKLGDDSMFSVPQTPKKSAPSSALTAKTDALVHTSQVQLDNASMLLYLGAFLFVASAGLFVVFGGISGQLRCLIVMLVAFVLYGGGNWLYHHNTKLQQAGLAFAGIGIAITPLIGLAAYNYVFDKSNGSAVWFGTSILCLALYTHALFSLRKPLINYLFILTFLSLFESAISMINVPIYYLGWTLAAYGIILAAISKYKGFWPEMQESSRLSGLVFLPISLFISLAMIPNHGTFQLGVSLILAAVFYGLEIMSTTGESQELNAMATQIAALAGVSSIVYSTNHSWLNVAVSLIVLCVIQIAVILTRNKTSNLSTNFASVAIASAVVAAVAGAKSPAVVLGALAVLALLSTVVWLRQKRIEAYSVAVAAIVALPLIYGQYYSSPHISFSAQSLLLLIPLLVQFIVIFVHGKQFSAHDLVTVRSLYVISGVVVIASSYWADPKLSLAISGLIAISMLPFCAREKYGEWPVISGLLVAGPLLWTWNEPGIFLSALLVSMVLNIYLALAYRNEFNRWISTVLWLLLPLGLGNISLFGHWSTNIYAWAYLVTMVGLILSRAIALGVLLISAKLPMGSFAKHASMAYVAGYWTSATLAVGLSFAYASHTQTALVLAAVTISVWALSVYVEKQPDLLVLIPIFIQTILFSLIQPRDGAQSMAVFTLSSTILASASYFIPPLFVNDKARQEAIRGGALLSLFIAPFAAVFTDQTIWIMPAGLLVASLIVFYHARSEKQEYKELAGGLVVLAIFWVLHYCGVKNPQPYTHILAALFAIYAYWRHKLSDAKQSDDYIMLALATTTIPLGLQALSGASGGIYGWWLILEQIAFMLIGMAIGKKLVIQWGLFVAVGAILYQLRGLGWAALSILAVFLIGLAIYKIQKYTDKK